MKSDGSLTVQGEKKTIPEGQVEAIADQLVQACPFVASPKEGVCADCFVYELNIQMDGQTYTVQALDTTLTEELRSLTTVLDGFLQAVGQ
jgi:hypothetical protein